MPLSPRQQQQIDTARRMLMQLDRPPACTVAAILGEHGLGDDDGERKGRLSCRLDALADAMAQADAAGGQPDLTPKWVQVATAGDYKGYAGGAFVFDDKTFAQIVNNFRQHPSYQAVNGVGAADVIPWDFNHASASFAADGSIPVSGTPAQGWIQELKTMPDAGGTQLWALTNWLEPARTYILQNKYKWASVVVGFDCRDQITNANIGAVLESVALTNNPFIEGMQKLVADRGAWPRGQHMKTNQLTLSLGRDGKGRLALGKAQIGENVGHFADSATDNPALVHLPTLDGNRFQEILSAARAAGMAGASPETLAAWLRGQGADVEKELATADPHRMAMICGSILRQLASESQPVGTGASPVHEITDIPASTLSRQLDARDQPGVNATHRAIVALRAASPRFAAMSFEAQVATAGAELRAGRVIA